MDFHQKEDRLETFNFNVKPCLHNEIQSISCVNNEFGIDHSDASQMFKLACTQIIFKDYLEHNKIKVNELQVTIDELYHQFVKEISVKKSSKTTFLQIILQKTNCYFIYYYAEYHRQHI